MFKIINRITSIFAILIVSIFLQSCSRTIYICGALTKSSLYTYKGKGSGSYNNQGGVNWDSKFGAQIGLAANIATLNKHFSFRTEINTSYQGASYEDVSYSVNGNINFLYTYVPFILRYRHDTGIFGEVGFQPGFLINARDRFNGKSTFYNDYIRKLDFGISAGVGYELNSNISLGLALYQGFANISKAGSDGKSNHVVALKAVYALKNK